MNRCKFIALIGDAVRGRFRVRSSGWISNVRGWSAYPPRLLRGCGHPDRAAMCRYCCKSPKLPGANFLAVKKSDRRPPIDVPSTTLPRPPASLISTSRHYERAWEAAPNKRESGLMKGSLEEMSDLRHIPNFLRIVNWSEHMPMSMAASVGGPPGGKSPTSNLSPLIRPRLKRTGVPAQRQRHRSDARAA
jgi:hypothetical protein